MPSSRDGADQSAPTLTAGQLTESIDTNDEVFAEVSMAPTTETRVSGKRTMHEYSLMQRRLSLISNEVDETLVRNDRAGVRVLDTQHEERIEERVRDLLLTLGANETDSPLRFLSSGFKHQRFFDPEPQLTSKDEEGWSKSHETLPEDESSMSVVEESSPVRGEPVLGNKDSAQPPRSNMEAYSRFNGPPTDSLQGKLPQQEPSTDRHHNKGSSEEALEEKMTRDIDSGHQSLEASIRRVLVGSPDYAEAIVTAFQRRLRGFESQSHGSPEVSELLAGAFQHLYDQSEDEAVDHGSSSAGKQSTGKEVRAGVSPIVPPTGSAILNRKPISHKRDREEDEKDPRKRSSSKKPCQEMSEKHWLCPYGARYQRLATGACRIPTTFRTFSDLKKHLLSKHCIKSGNVERPRYPELYMSNQQWSNIEEVADEADKTRPKHGTLASWEKQRSEFRDVWRILFPDAGFEPESPFWEDFIVGEIGMLSESIFDSRSQQAFERGEVSSPGEYRANRAEFIESMQQLFAIVVDYRPGMAGQVQDLIASFTPGITSGHQLSGSSVDVGPGFPRTATDALLRESAESSELTATSSHSGSGNSPQTSSLSSVSDISGGLKIDDQRPQQEIELTMLQLSTDLAMLETLDPRVLRDEIEWPPLGMDSMHSQREASQSMDYYCPPGAHTGSHPSDTTTSHLDQGLETPFLDMMESSMPFVAGFDFDWKEGKQEDPASISADWDQLPFSQPEEDTEYPWQEALQQ